MHSLMLRATNTLVRQRIADPVMTTVARASVTKDGNAALTFTADPAPNAQLRSTRRCR